MALFNFGKKRQAKIIGSVDHVGSIKVLGSGCKNCHALYDAAVKAASALDFAAEVEYITDMEKIMTYGVMRMPALVVDEKVLSEGRVLTAAEVEKLLRG